jgi:predicted phosphohydrolase
MKTRTLWLTDIHLNFLRNPDMCRMFGEAMRSEEVFDSVVITGDIAEAPSIVDRLRRFAGGVGEDRQVYFLPGNHDFYGGSLESVQAALSATLAPNLVYLDAQAPILLDEETALVGKYAWYDAMHGDGAKSNVMLHDFDSIKEFKAVFSEYSWEFDYDRGSRNALVGLFRRLAKEAAEAARISLTAALAARKQVVFATHVPPFPGACWHKGALSNAAWMPWFTCDAMGKMLLEVAAAHPDQPILTLCGHTHSPGTYQAAPNLRVLTGKARYGAPDPAGVITQEAFQGW